MKFTVVAVFLAFCSAVVVVESSGESSDEITDGFYKQLTFSVKVSAVGEIQACLFGLSADLNNFEHRQPRYSIFMEENTCVR